MKVRLLKRLRRRGYNKVTIYSVTTSNGIVVGMEYGHDGNYRGLFNYGDTEDDVRKKAMKKYIEEYITNHRKGGQS